MSPIKNFIFKIVIYCQILNIKNHKIGFFNHIKNYHLLIHIAQITLKKNLNYYRKLSCLNYYRFYKKGLDPSNCWKLLTSKYL